MRNASIVRSYHQYRRAHPGCDKDAALAAVLPKETKGQGGRMITLPIKPKKVHKIEKQLGLVKDKKL